MLLEVSNPLLYPDQKENKHTKTKQNYGPCGRCELPFRTNSLVQQSTSPFFIDEKPKTETGRAVNGHGLKLSGFKTEGTGSQSGLLLVAGISV